MTPEEKAAGEWTQNRCGNVAARFFGDEEFTPNPCLEAFLAGVKWAQENPGWISVKDNPPHKSCRVLAAPNTVAKVGTALYWLDLEGGPGRWQDLEDHTEPWTPAHWMPLPTPPQDNP